MTLLTVTYVVIVFFLMTLMFLWFSILKHITSSKLQKIQYLELEKNLIEGIVSSCSEDSKKLSLKKQQHTSKYIKNNDIQFNDVAHVFLKVNQVFKFSKSHNFKAFFYQLGLNKILLSNLKSKDWYEKAKAIWISYELELKENNLIISSYKDDKNRLVKREAQIALITFYGWKSLTSFLDVVAPISLWQQIRIIEKLHEIEQPFDLYSFEKALKADNCMTKELMVRIIKNFKLFNYKYYVVEQLNSENKQLVKVAKEALVQLDLEMKSAELKQFKLMSANNLNPLQAELLNNYLYVSN